MQAVHSINPEKVGQDHLSLLIKALRDGVAKANLKSYEEENTDIYVFATAGMRSISPAQQKKLYDNVTAYLSKNTKFRNKSAITISGKMEGTFGWIAVNYDMQKIGADDNFGVVDMGGASMQVIYALEDKSAVETINVKLGDALYYLHVVSYLGLGADHARFQFSDNPNCFPLNFPLADSMGNGKFEQGLKEINRLLREKKVLKKIPKDVNFVGIDNFYKIASSKQFELGDYITISSIKNKGLALASKSWEVLESEYPNDPSLFSIYFRSAYIIGVLEELGFKEDTKLYVRDISWTMGAALYLHDNKLQ